MSKCANFSRIKSVGAKVAITLALLLSNSARSQTIIASTKPAVELGMVMLLAAPQRFDHHVIRTWGFLNLRPDNDGIWLHEEDLQASLWKDSVELNLTAEQQKQFQNLNHTYVMVEGIFHANKTTSRALNSGTLVHITLVQGWKPFVQPSKK